MSMSNGEDVMADPEAVMFSWQVSWLVAAFDVPSVVLISGVQDLSLLYAQAGTWNVS